MAQGQEPKYRPEMLDTILEYAAIGCSIVQRADALNICRATYHNWINTDHANYNADFHAAHKIAEDKCQAWWEELGRKYVLEISKDSPHLNAQVYRMNMENRFHWSANQRNENNNKNTTIVINDGGSSPELDSYNESD